MRGEDGCASCFDDASGCAAYEPLKLVWRACLPGCSMAHSPAFRRWAIASGIVWAPPPTREARGGGGVRGVLLNNAVLRRMQLGQVRLTGAGQRAAPRHAGICPTHAMAPAVAQHCLWQREAGAGRLRPFFSRSSPDLPAAYAWVQLSKKKMRSLAELDRDVEAPLPLADCHAGSRAQPERLPSGGLSKHHAAAAAADKGPAGAAHVAAEPAAQQQLQQGDGASTPSSPVPPPGLKSPQGASLQYRVTTRSMAARASGATSPTAHLLPGVVSRSNSRTGGSRPAGSVRRRCLPLRMHLCTVVAAHLAVAALLGAGEVGQGGRPPPLCRPQGALAGLQRRPATQFNLAHRRACSCIAACFCTAACFGCRLAQAAACAPAAAAGVGQCCPPHRHDAGVGQLRPCTSAMPPLAARSGRLPVCGTLPGGVQAVHRGRAVQPGKLNCVPGQPEASGAGFQPGVAAGLGFQGFNPEKDPGCAPTPGDMARPTHL